MDSNRGTFSNDNSIILIYLFNSFLVILIHFSFTLFFLNLLSGMPVATLYLSVSVSLSW